MTHAPGPWYDPGLAASATDGTTIPGPVTFVDYDLSSNVLVDGKVVGTIRWTAGGWQYRTDGGKHGAYYPSLTECKGALEPATGTPPFTYRRTA